MLPSLLPEQFPVEVRAIGVPLSFSTAVSIFGGLAPLVATWLIVQTGDSAVENSGRRDRRVYCDSMGHVIAGLRDRGGGGGGAYTSG